ncbi:A/G-specific adenine glycosylase [Acidocella sp.]|uniref:A/G-specific adenine glycosylase n=1 Tax=Acidocella sp. TaxID=50710 RepID=UPI0038CF7281
MALVAHRSSSPSSRSAPSASRLLSWYARARRDLPWRAKPGEAAAPYHVWLSEIMLQQTVAATVKPYYAKFLASFPRIEDLAAAGVEEVCALWAGLGYYARARNLHKCAQAVAALGGFPADVAGLRALPGIGPYTARAVAAIAFNAPVLPVDGNVERVTARVFGIEAPLPRAKALLATTAERLMDDPAARAAPGDFAQALFDLGATICTPKSPDCRVCPWADACAARARGIAAELPRRAPKPPKPHRTGEVYALIDQQGEALLERNPPRGLLGGMLVLPSQPPVARAAWRPAGRVSHVFTHFTLELAVLVARCRHLPNQGERAPAATAPVPSVMRKALDAALGALKVQSHDD